MAKRRSVRRPRRVQVQFWRRGEAQSYPGYTTNISTTGMFLATNSPQPPGTRVRIEVLEGGHGFMVEGVVAHARKIRGDMMRLSHPGMGIRFLEVEELIRELIPVLPGETEEIPETDRDWGRPAAQPAAQRRAAEPPPGPPRMPPPKPAVHPPAPSPPLSTLPLRPAAAPEPAPRPAPPPLRAPEATPRPIEGTGSFKVEFLGPAEFLEVFHRDIVNGGLFVSTRYPGRLQETVRIDIQPPLPSAPPVSLRARVVQRFVPQGTDLRPNLLSGMGVEILDLSSVLERLQAVVDRLKFS